MKEHTLLRTFFPTALTLKICSAPLHPRRQTPSCKRTHSPWDGLVLHWRTVTSSVVEGLQKSHQIESWLWAPWQEVKTCSIQEVVALVFCWHGDLVRDCFCPFRGAGMWCCFQSLREEGERTALLSSLSLSQLTASHQLPGGSDETPERFSTLESFHTCQHDIRMVAESWNTLSVRQCLVTIAAKSQWCLDYTSPDTSCLGKEPGRESSKLVTAAVWLICCSGASNFYSRLLM